MKNQRTKAAMTKEQEQKLNSMKKMKALRSARARLAKSKRRTKQLVREVKEAASRLRKAEHGLRRALSRTQQDSKWCSWISQKEETFDLPDSDIPGGNLGAFMWIRHAATVVWYSAVKDDIKPRALYITQIIDRGIGHAQHIEVLGLYAGETPPRSPVDRAVEDGLGSVDQLTASAALTTAAGSGDGMIKPWAG